MANCVSGFREISSFKELKSWLPPDPDKPDRASEPPLDQAEWGIALFDFDQCLVQGPPTFGDEHFYTSLIKFNEQDGKKRADRFSHYKWTVQVRNGITYEACEKITRVNKLIERLRDAGWTVKILTSRGLDMRECTIKHLSDSGIKLTIEDVIFKNSRTEKKNESLIRWMQTQAQWEMAQAIRVKFTDDQKKYCDEVANIPNDVRQVSKKIERVSVECCLYTGALPNPELSDAQKERVVVQLNAYHHNQTIPYTYTEEDVTQAMKELGIEKRVGGKIDGYELFLKIKEVAASKGFPF